MFNIGTKLRAEVIIEDLNELIKLGYGTYPELINLTTRDYNDIMRTLNNKQEQEKLGKAL